MNFIERWCAKTGFEMFQVEKEFMNDLLASTPKYRLAIEKDISPQYYLEGQQRLQGKIAMNWNNLFIGPPGKGKSWSSLYTYVYGMELMGSEIDIGKHFSFDKTILIQKLAQVVQEYLGKDLDLFLNEGKIVRVKVSMNLDEDVQPAGKGKIIEQDTLLSIEKTVRQAMINFNYCSPILVKSIYTTILRVFAINFDRNETVAFALNPETMNPVGTVRFGLPPDKIIAEYEREKNKFLIKAGKGEFGGGRLSLKRNIAKQIIDEHFDEMNNAENKRVQMMIIEEVAAGKLSMDEQKDVYEIIMKECSDLSKRHKRKVRDDEDE